MSGMRAERGQRGGRGRCLPRPRGAAARRRWRCCLPAAAAAAAHQKQPVPRIAVATAAGGCRGGRAPGRESDGSHCVSALSTGPRTGYPPGYPPLKPRGELTPDRARTPWPTAHLRSRPRRLRLQQSARRGGAHRQGALRASAAVAARRSGATEGRRCVPAARVRDGGGMPVCGGSSCAGVCMCMRGPQGLVARRWPHAALAGLGRAHCATAAAAAGGVAAAALAGHAQTWNGPVDVARGAGAGASGRGGAAEGVRRSVDARRSEQATRMVDVGGRFDSKNGSPNVRSRLMTSPFAGRSWVTWGSYLAPTRLFASPLGYPWRRFYQKRCQHIESHDRGDEPLQQITA
jgi:hypothetical protein